MLDMVYNVSITLEITMKCNLATRMSYAVLAAISCQFGVDIL